jgi:sugar-specific transcriptional regulator TrmB
MQNAKKSQKLIRLIRILQESRRGEKRVFSQEAVSVFSRLGLTESQAKVYVAIAQAGAASAAEIAKTSAIARSDVYRVTPMLEEIGLIEKEIGVPIVFRAMPMQQALEVMTKRKTSEIAEIEADAKQALKKLGNNGSLTQTQESKLIITSEKKLFEKRMDIQVHEAQLSLEAIGTPEALKSMVYNQISDLKRAIKRGVIIRVITEKHYQPKAITKILEDLERNSLFKVKYLSTPVPVMISITDKKIVNIMMTPDELPCLCVSNHPILTISQGYFEAMWNAAESAIKISTKKP